MKVGFVAILGRPNVGKSTLLNALLSKKVSIVSPRAQTTRDEISGILNEKDKQIVFVDTPGIFQGKAGLDKYMNKASKDAARDVNAVLFLMDSHDPDLDKDFKILSTVSSKAPVYVVLNKIDLCKAEEVMAIKERLAKEFPTYQVIEASLIENFGLKPIKDAVEPTLTEGLPYYPEDSLTDKDHSYQTREVIRQELLHFLKDEVPHQAAVKVDSLKMVDKGYKIQATIYVNKKSHKGIVVGKGGEMIKKISMSARHELERMWHEHISQLRIEVECSPDWRDNPKMLKELDYVG